MARELLWKALAEATDAAQVATHEHAQEATPQARAAAEAAMQEYVSRLAPVIGRVAAFTYEVSLRTHQDAVDRLDGLNATIDAGEAVDMKLWLKFFEEVAAAREHTRLLRPPWPPQWIRQEHTNVFHVCPIPWSAAC